MNKITLETKMTMDDFIKVNYHLLYRKWSMKIITGIGVVMLVLIATSYSTYDQFPFIQLVFGLLMVFGIPISVYFTARRNYKSNSRISETINYEFDDTNIQLTGESFNSRLTWEKIYSVTENKDWILVWQNRQVANVIPKRYFNNDTLTMFKAIVNGQKGLKNKMKK